MASFEDLGLREPLLRALEDAGIEHPTALQEAVIPVLRREGNLVARTSAGSGKTLAYTLGVLDRIEPREAAEGEEAPGVRVLVLLPTTEAAERTALSVVAYAQAAELTVSVAGGSWGTPPSQAEVVLTAPEDALRAVRASALKLDALETVVLDGASDILALGGWDAVETLLDHAPREAQRVVVSTAFPAEVDDLIDRRVKRALRYPAEPAVPEAEAPAPEGTLEYALISEGERIDALSRFLSHPREGGTAPVLFSRTDERAAEVAEALSLRGFLVGELDDPDADVAVVAAGTGREELAEESGEEPVRTISFDVPPDERTLLHRHRGDPDALVLLDPRELPHLREIAGRARLTLRAVPLPFPETAATGLAAFRGELRRALREEDLAAQMLVLEPLFAEFGAAEVAAAAAFLLRTRRPAAAGAPAAGAPAEPAARAPRAAAPEGAPTGPAPTAWARLYVGVGSRDGIRPGDLVGAIAGEADIPGSQVGKIEIRDTFSIVEVQSGIAEKVIRSLNGTSIKGRSVRVDYDRAPDRARKPGGTRRPGGERKPGPRPGPRRTPPRT